MSLNGITGTSLFSRTAKIDKRTSSGSTDRYSVSFQPTPQMPTEEAPIATEAPPESLPQTSAPTSENVEKILATLQEIQSKDAEILTKQEHLPTEIELQISKNLKALTAEAAQKYDEYLKAITLQRVNDARRELLRLDELGKEYEKRILFSTRLKKICVALLVANATLLTAILLILILK